MKILYDATRKHPEKYKRNYQTIRIRNVEKILNIRPAMGKNIHTYINKKRRNITKK